MTGFTDLEIAALRAIFVETPALAPALERQLQAAVVAERKNSGVGFFTRIAVADHAPGVNSPSVLGHSTHAHVNGLEHGFGFVLFMEGGRLHMLEGFAYAADSTHDLDLTTLQFTIYDEPAHGLG